MVAEKEIAIEVKNVRKDFVLRQNKSSTLKQAAVNVFKKDKKTVFHALDDVSLDICKGDFFGIIGRNGSGKSTLLKLIAGVYEPTAGNIYVHGGLTPFIELGVGFNPELSGRDNVFLNGAILGFSRKQMAAIYEEIVEFAELGPFMDQKLKNYSSGMQVRLAFSIAITAKNDILMFDEVLAVGDEAFQRKCIDVFERYKSEKQTIVLVTHNMEMVRRFCSKAALIHEGALIKVGSPGLVADTYSTLNRNIPMGDIPGAIKGGTGMIESVELTCKTCPLSAYISGSEMDLVVKLGAGLMPHGLVINLYKSTGEYIIGLRAPKGAIKKDGKTTLSLSPAIGLGEYYFTAEAYGNDDKLADNIYKSQPFIVSRHSVSDPGDWAGMFAVDHVWK